MVNKTSTHFPRRDRERCRIYDQSHLMLVDHAGRLFRDGKAAIAAEVTGMLDRLQSSAESWRARLEKLRGGRLLGRFFAASRERCARSQHSWGYTTSRTRRMPGSIAQWQSATRSQVSTRRSATVLAFAARPDRPIVISHDACPWRCVRPDHAIHHIAPASLCMSCYPHRPPSLSMSCNLLLVKQVQKPIDQATLITTRPFPTSGQVKMRSSSGENAIS